MPIRCDPSSQVPACFAWVISQLVWSTILGLMSGVAVLSTRMTWLSSGVSPGIDIVRWKSFIENEALSDPCSDFDDVCLDQHLIHNFCRKICIEAFGCEAKVDENVKINPDVSLLMHGFLSASGQYFHCCYSFGLTDSAERLRCFSPKNVWLAGILFQLRWLGITKKNDS